MNGNQNKPIEEVTVAIINRLLQNKAYWVTLTSGDVEPLPRQKLRLEYTLGSFVNTDELNWGPVKQAATFNYIIFCMAPTGPFFNKALLLKERSLGVGDSICLPARSFRLKYLPDIPQRRA